MPPGVKGVVIRFDEDRPPIRVDGSIMPSTSAVDAVNRNRPTRGPGDSNQQAIQGLVALFNRGYHVGCAVWGWTHLILGILAAATGLGLLAGLRRRPGSARR